DLIGEVARLLQARAEEEIAVRKERVSAPAIVGRPAERGQIVGQVIEPLGPRSHAVVVSEEIEDLAVGTGRDERADPLLRRIGRALDRAERRPIEIEDVAVEDEQLAPPRRLDDLGRVPTTLASLGKEVQVGYDGPNRSQWRLPTRECLVERWSQTASVDLARDSGKGTHTNTPEDDSAEPADCQIGLKD